LNSSVNVLRAFLGIRLSSSDSRCVRVSTKAGEVHSLPLVSLSDDDIAALCDSSVLARLRLPDLNGYDLIKWSREPAVAYRRSARARRMLEVAGYQRVIDLGAMKNL